MTSLTRFELTEGLELFIDTETGEAFATVTGYALMANKAKSTISERLQGVRSEDIKTAEIFTPGGLQGVRLIPAKLVFQWLIKDNPELALVMGEVGATVYLHKLAGYTFTSSAIENKSKIEELLTNILDRISNLENNLSNSEYSTLKTFTDEKYKGLSKINNDIVSHFTAPEWIKRNGKHLTQHQQINFYKEIAGNHKSLVDKPPIKIKGIYQYNSDHEILFKRVLEYVEKMPTKPDKIKKLYITLRSLLLEIHNPLPTNKMAWLRLALKKYEQNGSIISKTPKEKGYQKLFLKTPELIEIIKNILERNQ